MSRALFISLLCASAIALLSPAPPARQLSWQSIQPGVEFASIHLGEADSDLYVVRVDPTRARLTVALASESQANARTAAEWCRTSDLAVAINLGMFQNDGRSNVGYLRHASHLNNARWNNYQSVLAINPADQALPHVLWVDRDQANSLEQLSGYEIVVQNLRLITKDRRNVWSRSNKRWSEAAVAIDSKGRLLFLFCRRPYSMQEFNALLLSLPLDVTGAMHVEGGPEASLSIHTATINLDLMGSYETGFWPDDSNRKQWRIPNVLGVLSSVSDRRR